MLEIFKMLFDPGFQKEDFPVSLAQATQVAMSISSDFEGTGGFGTIASNFDGQILTCGALGWTWKTGEQQKMVLKFDNVNPGRIKKYMPFTWHEYFDLCCLGIDESSKKMTWSRKLTVDSPYSTELRDLWGSPEMAIIQIESANQISDQACHYAKNWAAGLGVKDFTLQEFCFFFDVVVNNGSLAHLTYLDVETRITESKDIMKEILDWCEVQQNRDCRLNSNYWQTVDISDDERYLLVMGWLRALKSKKEWAGSVMNRRGILAVGSGFNQGVKKDLYSKYAGFQKTFVST